MSFAIDGERAREDAVAHRRLISRVSDRSASFVIHRDALLFREIRIEERVRMDGTCHVQKTRDLLPRVNRVGFFPIYSAVNAARHDAI